jgi:hypothetical protein
LLYGSSAIGGLVNAVSGHDSAHKGLRGFFNTVGGANNGTGGASGGIEGGTEKWLFWAGGGGQRAGDYKTPLGQTLNSGLRNYDVSGGGGYYGEKAFFRAGYGYNSNRFGIPFDPAEEDPEVAELDLKRHNLRINAGLHNLAGASNTTVTTPRNQQIFAIGRSPAFPARRASARRCGKAARFRPTTRIRTARRRSMSFITTARIRAI